MRVPAFVSGGVVPPALRGTASDALIHVADCASAMVLCLPCRCASQAAVDRVQHVRCHGWRRSEGRQPDPTTTV